MSLTSSVQRIVTAKANIKSAIENKGVTVGDDVSIVDYPDYIAAITGGGGSGATQTKTVVLDMANGDQVVSPDEGYTLSQVTITKPATLVASNIKLGVTIGGVEGTLVSGTNPTLNAPTIAKSNNTVTITNPSTNGNFNYGFKGFNSGVKFLEQTAASIDLQKIANKSYVLTCRCTNSDGGFLDSVDSNSITLTVFAFADRTANVDTTFDWKNNSNGISLSFVITPKTGYYLPPRIDILCNGEKLDYTYNPYSGSVTISALELSYSGTPSDMGQLPTPIINKIQDDIADITTGAGTEGFKAYYDDGTEIGTAAVSGGGDPTLVEVGAFGVSTPKLVAPLIALADDDLSIVDSFLKKGDVLFSEDYSLYVDGTLVKNDIDATQDQAAVISYTNVRNFALQGTGYYKSNNTGANTWALLRVYIITPQATTVRVDFTAYTRSSYCYAYLGKLDVEFSDNNNTESNYQLAYTSSATTTSNYTLSVPQGAHYVYFKYRRGNTTSYSDRYLQVKVTEVTA